MGKPEHAGKQKLNPFTTRKRLASRSKHKVLPLSYAGKKQSRAPLRLLK